MIVYLSHIIGFLLVFSPETSSFSASSKAAGTFEKAQRGKSTGYATLNIDGSIQKKVVADTLIANRIGSNGGKGGNSEDIMLKNIGGESVVSAAELVSKALSGREVLDAVESLIYPGEETLHYQMQAVHQRKRQKVATNALKRLVKFLIGVLADEERKQLVEEKAFYRLCVCATSAINERAKDSNSPSTYWIDRSDISSYLDVIYSLAALAPLPQDVTINAIHPLLKELNKLFMNGMKNNELKFTPTEITSLGYSCERLSYSIPKKMSTENKHFISTSMFSGANDILAARKKLQLPFGILHGLVKGINDDVCFTEL